MKKLFFLFLTVLSGSLTAQEAGLSGTIQDLSGVPLSAVIVELRNGQDSLLASTQTDESGFYAFTGLQSGEQGYRLNMRKMGPPLENVSTFDIVLTSRHILSINPFDSPAKYLAADVNGSETVTTFDLVSIRRLILNIINDFPEGETLGQWRFLPTGWSAPNAGNPLPALGPSFPIQLAEGANTFPITGVKLGNLN